MTADTHLHTDCERLLFRFNQVVRERDVLKERLRLAHGPARPNLAAIRDELDTAIHGLDVLLGDRWSDANRRRAQQAINAMTDVVRVLYVLDEVQ